jgi:hypothetical protein
MLRNVYVGRQRSCHGDSDGGEGLRKRRRIVNGSNNNRCNELCAPNERYRDPDGGGEREASFKGWWGNRVSEQAPCARGWAATRWAARRAADLPGPAQLTRYFVVPAYGGV